MLVGDVAVGEDNLVDRTIPAQLVELRLRNDGNSTGIERARERRRIAPPGNAGIWAAVKATTSTEGSLR